MKILLMDWNSIGNLDITQHFTELGHTVIPCPFSTKVGRKNEEWESSFSDTLRLLVPDMVFSFNYFPIISTVCERESIPYYSWVYDSPLHALYSKTIYHKCNHVFLFDSELCKQLNQQGITTVHYLPLAVNTSRLCDVSSTAANMKQYQCDISFVGSLYTEEKHQLFSRLSGVDEYTKGYLDALIETQKNVYGSHIMKDAISPKLLAEMERAYPVTVHDDGMETPLDLYHDYFLLREVTARERLEALTTIGTTFGNEYRISLYTHNTKLEIPGVSIHSEVDYYNQMPFVLQNSRINLNITLRSIMSGIPLRALDIMGCGGFLLTNYQADFFDELIPEKDFVFYESKQDLVKKITYYLKHDKLRNEIAKNGYQKMCECFDYSIALKKMLQAM